MSKNSQRRRKELREQIRQSGRMPGIDTNRFVPEQRAVALTVPDNPTPEVLIVDVEGVSRLSNDICSECRRRLERTGDESLRWCNNCGQYLRKRDGNFLFI